MRRVPNDTSTAARIPFLRLTSNFFWQDAEVRWLNLADVIPAKSLP
jgi:hypothetical protein